MQYIPLLKAKLGELQAIKDLESSVKDYIKPLIEIVDIPWDFDADDYSKTVDEHLTGTAKKINESWKDRPFLIDFPASIWSEEMASGVHPLLSVCRELNAVGATAIPVTGATRPAEYQNAVKELIKVDGRGVCLRLRPGDIASESAILTSLLEVKPSDTDLIIDFQEILPEQADIVQLSFQGAIRGLVIADWRSITFAASSFPKDMSGYRSGDVASISRGELITWKKIHATAGLETIQYGDYTISNPQLVVVDFRLMQMSANIRYTAEDTWVILRGAGVRRNGFSQFVGLAKKLIGLPVYKGPTFSAGDKFIKDCADGKTGPGSAMVWRKVGVNHHITLTQSQIASS